MTHMDNLEHYFDDMVAQILCECATAGLYPPEYLAKEIAVCEIKNADNWSSGSHKTRADEINMIVQLTVNKILEQKQPNLLLLELQAFMNREYINSAQALTIWKEIETNALSPLVELILCEENPDLLFEQILFYCILYSNMGSPLDDVTYKESKDAFISLVPMENLRKLPSKINKDETDFIDHIAELVAGIRLFNQARGYGGSTIPDYWSLAKEGMEACTTHVSKIQNVINGSLKGVLNVLLPLYSWDEEMDVINVNYTKTFSNENFEYTITYLLLLSQIDLWLKQFATTLHRIDVELATMMTMREACFEALRDKVDQRIEVSIEDAHEYIFGLSSCWRFYFHSLVIINSISKVVQKLMNHIQMLKDNCAEVEDNQDGSMNMLDFFDRFTAGQEADLSECGMQGKEKIDPARISLPVVFVEYEVDAPGIEFNGYDIVYIIEGKGITLKGDFTLGIVMYEGFGHIFYDARSAYMYAKQPAVYRMKLIDYCRRHPEYSLIVRVTTDIRRVKRRGFFLNDTRPVVPTREEAVQTDLHPHESWIDKKYMSSCWELRKEAVKLANIVKCQTHSTQTILSNWREGMSSQTQGTKDQEVQTMRDEWTNVPHLKNFIKDLRGEKDPKYGGLVILTRPPKEEVSQVIPEIAERPC